MHAHIARDSQSSRALLARHCRTWYGILLHSRHVGDEISLLVRRKSAGYALQSVKFPLLPLTMLVPTPTYDVPPSYFLYCGLLFQPLSKDYLTTWSNWRKNAPKEYVHFYECGVPLLSPYIIIIEH